MNPTTLELRLTMLALGLFCVLCMIMALHADIKRLQKLTEPKLVFVRPKRETPPDANPAALDIIDVDGG